MVTPTGRRRRGARPAPALTLRRVPALVWASPWSALGLLLAAVAALGGARARWVGGALEVGGGRLARWVARRGPFGVLALTLGHVILGRDLPTLEALREHEMVHVRQYEAWGPLFVPAYVLNSAWHWARGGHPYLDNRFEREARSADRPAR